MQIAAYQSSRNFVLCLLIISSCLFIADKVSGEEFILSGSQHSSIEYKLFQRIDPVPGIEDLKVSFVIPSDFSSLTYSQDISNIEFDFSFQPGSSSTIADSHGNKIITYIWKRPTKSITCEVSFDVTSEVLLDRLDSSTPFPDAGFPKDIQVYLQPTSVVQSNHPSIKSKAESLTEGISDQYAAVQAILHYLVDHLKYVLIPQKFDALYSLETGKGNCQNYSHLAAALMRSVGIPVRIVNGVSLKKAFNIEAGEYVHTFEMAQGRHAWIEVYFADNGWIPFDPQQSSYFVENRYIRIEVGLDNEETENDGLVRWTRRPGSGGGQPGFEESFNADFVNDIITLSCDRISYQTRNLLLTPELEIIQPVTGIPDIMEDIVTVPAEHDYSRLAYTIPFQAGNVEFPVKFNFLAARFLGETEKTDTGELKRNFIVETAEYVTGNRQFAQVFILSDPVVLQSIDLALHSFGAGGDLWIELYEDLNGKPGTLAATSNIVSSANVYSKPGYDWAAFDFSKSSIGLTPGNYWIVLKYSDSPIINWFYTYGKPVGPINGTLRSDSGKNNWNRVLPYEFVYRIRGLSPEE